MKQAFELTIVAAENDDGAEILSVTARACDGASLLVNRYQYTSILACCTYVAHTARTMDSMVEDLFCLSFDIDASNQLPASRFEDAMQWFCDFDMKKFIQ